MDCSFTCTSVKEFNATLKSIKKSIYVNIERICNIGSFQFSEYPLFLYTEQNVFRIFYFERKLHLDVYVRNDFLKMQDRDIVRYSNEPSDFDYIYPFDVYTPNSQLCGFLPVKGCGTTNNLNGFDLRFSNGSILYIRSSDAVPGAMDSWIEQ